MMTDLLDKLKTETVLDRDEYLGLIINRNQVREYATELASAGSSAAAPPWVYASFLLLLWEQAPILKDSA